MSMPATASKLAALVYADEVTRGEAADALVRTVCHDLQRQGWRVGGLWQQHVPVAAGRKPPMQVVDLRTGRVFGISQNCGALSQGCCLDPGGVAQASVVLRQALADRVHLAVANRFGALEATGRGLADELATLACAGIPVLTVVARKHLTAWRDFTGGAGTELPLHLPALREWCARALVHQELA